MNVVDVMFHEDIVIDQEAFDRASQQFEDLKQKLETLKTEVESMLNTLKEGFNTPAGQQFIEACNNNLFKPIDDQEKVIEHISQTLKESKDKYQAVFAEYEALKNEINSAGGGFR